MTVVINEAGIQALLRSPGVLAEIEQRTDAIYENAFDNISEIIPGIRGSQITNPLVKTLTAGEGIVYLSENNFSGTRKSVARYLGEKQQAPREGVGWFTKAIIAAGFRPAEGQ